MIKHLLLLIFIVTGISLYPETWFKTNLTIVDTTSDGVTIKNSLVDTKNNKVVVKYPINFSDENADKIQKALIQITSWNSVKYELIKFSVLDNITEIIILLDEIKLNKVNLIQYIPSGMLFYITSQGLEYDFRINAEDFFLRINGVYINSAEFFTKLEDALKNPENYIERHDPDFYMAKINKLNQMLEKSMTESDRMKRYLINKDSFFVKVNDNLIDAIISIKRKKYDVTFSEIMTQLAEENIKASKAHVETVLKFF